MTRRAQLYAAEVSLYSGKARAYLRYKRVPFDEILPSREAIERVIKPRTGLRMVPVLIDEDDVAVGDTTVIIDHVEARVSERPVVPTTPKRRFVAQLLELYADEWLLMPAMHYRWAYPRHHLLFIAREFGALFKPDWPEPMHVVAGLPLVAYFGLAHGPALGINRHNRPAIEAWYERFLAQFDAHLAEHHYALGPRPTLADFGLMAPLYAHLYRDPYSGQLMRRLAPRVHDWVERMNAPEDQSLDAPFEVVGEDHVPPTLFPILAHALDEHLPVVHATWDAMEHWHGAHPDASTFPRFVGRHAFRIGASTSERSAQSYTAWMSQRMFSAWQALGDEDRAFFAEALGSKRVATLDVALPFVLERTDRGRVRVAPKS